MSERIPPRRPTRGSARTAPMLQALADAPDGLTTEELTAKFAADVANPRQAFTRCYQLMADQETHGRVRRGEPAAHATRNIPVIVWQITTRGRAYLRGIRDDLPRGPSGTVVLVLGLLEHSATAAEVREWLAADGVRLTMRQVSNALQYAARLDPPLVRRAGGGLWQQTRYASEVIAASCGEELEDK